MDLSTLTDDQLVEVARLVAREIGRRDPDVAAVARDLMLDEAEKARVARLATDAEIARLREIERRSIEAEARARVLASAPPAPIVRDPVAVAIAAQQRTLAEQVHKILGRGWSMTVWRRDGDRRVYLDRDQEKITCWLTGADGHAPMSINLRRVKADRKQIAALCELAGGWFSRTRFDCDEAAGTDVSPAPLPQSYNGGIS